MDEKFTPEEIAKSLRVCIEVGGGSASKCRLCALHGRFFERDCFDELNEQAADMIEAQAKRIEELEAELEKLRRENRWIPTSERLPDQELEAEPKDADGKPLLGGYECIAQIEGDKRPTALWYCRIDGEGVWTDESGENFYRVTHWKPMPKGPEAE